MATESWSTTYVASLPCRAMPATPMPLTPSYSLQKARHDHCRTQAPGRYGPFCSRRRFAELVHDTPVMADVAETYTARPLGCAFSRGVVQCGNADLNCTLSATGIAHSGVADPEVVAARPPTGQAGGRGGVVGGAPCFLISPLRAAGMPRGGGPAGGGGAPGPPGGGPGGRGGVAVCG